MSRDAKFKIAIFVCDGMAALCMTMAAIGYAAGCGMPAKTIANEVLSIEQLVCLASHAFGPAEPTAVVAVCAIPPALEQQAIDHLFASRKGFAMARPGGCREAASK